MRTVPPHLLLRPPDRILPSFKPILRGQVVRIVVEEENMKKLMRALAGWEFPPEVVTLEELLRCGAEVIPSCESRYQQNPFTRQHLINGVEQGVFIPIKNIYQVNINIF